MHPTEPDILKQYAANLSQPKTQEINDLLDFIAWQTRGQLEHFAPHRNDDVDLRTYLLEMKNRGISPREQKRRFAALRRFYGWALQSGLISLDPFEEFSIERPTLTPEQIRRRAEIFSGTTEARQIAHLQVLNQLAGELNRSPGMQAALEIAQNSLLSLMHLQTAWVFLLPAAGLPPGAWVGPQLHDFMLAAAAGLPPGLEQDKRYHLCKPDDCHCQIMLRQGQMQRAVNVVECTRLLDSAEANGNNRGLLFHASIPLVIGGEPLGIINVATDEWQFLTSEDLTLLSAIGAQVAVALERAYLYDQAVQQRQRLERELALASAVQSSLLPEHLPEIPGFSLAADWQPARQMAGDFYDVFPLPGERWGLVIADVADKGAPAAMIMAMTRSLIREAASQHTSPAQTLLQVNQRMLAHSSSVLFVTAIFGVLDPAARNLTYANAGHNPPLLRHVDGSQDKLMPTGPLLGVLDAPDLADQIITLQPHEILLCYTDGVTDALDPQGSSFGLERLESLLTGVRAASASKLLEELTKTLQRFTSQAEPFDDITLLILQAIE